MLFKWHTFNKNSKRFEFLLTMSFYWHKCSFSWSAFILMTSLCVHSHYYWRCADKWSFIMTVYTWLLSHHGPDVEFDILKIHLHPQKVGVWCAMSRWRIVDPSFFSSTITGETYREIIFQFVANLNKIRSGPDSSRTMPGLTSLSKQWGCRVHFLGVVSFLLIYGHLGALIYFP